VNCNLQHEIFLVSIEFVSITSLRFGIEKMTNTKDLSVEAKRSILDWGWVGLDLKKMHLKMSISEVHFERPRTF